MTVLVGSDGREAKYVVGDAPGADEDGEARLINDDSGASKRRPVDMRWRRRARLDVILRKTCC